MIAPIVVHTADPPCVQGIVAVVVDCSTNQREAMVEEAVSKWVAVEVEAQVFVVLMSLSPKTARVCNVRTCAATTPEALEEPAVVADSSIQHVEWE